MPGHLDEFDERGVILTSSMSEVAQRSSITLALTE